MILAESVVGRTVESGEVVYDLFIGEELVKTFRSKEELDEALGVLRNLCVALVSAYFWKS